MQIALNSNYCLYRCPTHWLLQLQPFLLPCSTTFIFPTLRPLHCRSMALSPPSVQVRDTIDLTPKETQIFQKLLQVVRHFSLRTQLRVAGGWVRDKLLGKECYDIDIALDDILFYNINTSSVGDFTGRGIEDLKSGKIVTPLPPKDTFLDDPLRVLWAIHFGATFGFILDEELKLAAGCDDVRAAIADKISIEHIGHEDEQRRLHLYAALFLPFRKTLYEGGKARKIPVVNHIIHNCLKLSASDADTNCVTGSQFIRVIGGLAAIESIINSPKPWNSTGSEPLVFLSENSYYSLTKGGWKASGYAHPIEYNGTNERGSRPHAKFDQDITFNSTSIYSSSSTSWMVQGVEMFHEMYKRGDKVNTLLLKSFCPLDLTLFTLCMTWIH
ncbi:hypothetical protein PVL29_024637 [Vitis rotundifolia]|uniref:Poly A polymerase head domain-containing protein n=1 Tax=Vitis rotundifolia TaxID=103349 RepID=A0AA39D9B7_VITRO|nr:hypothetical protein PVL29_024637 [Vitis rotundifolia]